MKVGEIRDIETNELRGYLLNGTFVPLNKNNRHYQEIQKWIEKGNKPEPAFTEEERLNYFKNKLINNIQNIADAKSKEVKNYIAGKKLTDEQINRYELKYQTALKCKESGDYTPLKLEADLQGIKKEKLAELIIQTHDDWVSALKKYISLIEAFRVKALNIVTNITTVEQLEIVRRNLFKINDMELSEKNIKDLFKKIEEQL